MRFRRLSGAIPLAEDCGAQVPVPSIPEIERSSEANFAGRSGSHRSASRLRTHGGEVAYGPSQGIECGAEIAGFHRMRNLVVIQADRIMYSPVTWWRSLLLAAGLPSLRLDFCFGGYG